MHHKTGTTPFDINLSDASTIEASKLLQEAGEDVYLLFVQMQEALMEPYGTDAATYMQLLPTAAVFHASKKKRARHRRRQTASVMTTSRSNGTYVENHLRLCLLHF